MEFCHTITSPYSPHGQKTLFSLGEQVRKILALVGAKEEVCACSFHEKELLHEIYSALYHKISKETGKCQVLFGFAPSYFQSQVIKEWENFGIYTKFLSWKPDQEQLIEIIEKQITARTAMVRLPWICPLTGVILPIEEISQICQAKGAVFYLDLSYGAQERVFTASALPCDMMSMGAKAFGVDSDIELVMGKHPLCKELLEKIPLPPLEDLVEFHRALEKSIDNVEQMIMQYSLLQEGFEKKLTSLCEGVKVYQENHDRSVRTSCVFFPKVHGEMLLFALQKMEFFATLGGGKEPLVKDLLLSQGVSLQDALCYLSFQFHEQMDQLTLDKGVDVLAEAVKKIQKMSPL